MSVCRRRLADFFIPLVALAQVVYFGAQLGSHLLARDLWAADMANFIRPHLLAAGIGLFATGLLLPSRLTRIGAVISLLAAIFPFVFLPAPASETDGVRFTIVSANVLSDNRNPRPFLTIPEVASSDIIVLQEMRPVWQDALVDSGLWSYESNRDLRANADMKVFSRFPIVSEEVVSPASRDTGGRHPLRLELLIEGRTVVLYAVHAQTPRRPSMWRERAAYFRDLTQALQQEDGDAAVMIAGDWNMPPWSRFFQDFLAETGYRTTESAWWPAPTRFSTRFGDIPALGTPIDRIVISPNMGLASLLLGPRFQSNHLPVIARLTLP